MRTLAGHTEGVRSILFLDGGKLLASAGDDKTIRLWEVATGREKQKLEGHTLGVTCLALSPDGKTLASGSGDGHNRAPAEILLWDVASWQRNGRSIAVEREVWSLAWTSDSKRLAAAVGSGQLRVLDVASGRALATTPAPAIRPLAMAPGGGLLASGQGTEEDGTVRLWGTRGWQERAVLTGHQKMIFGVTFSPDGQRLASASMDGTIRLWTVPR